MLKRVCWYVVLIRLMDKSTTFYTFSEENSAPRTRASQHLRGWRDVGRLWHSNARNACPWPRQWKVGTFFAYITILSTQSAFSAFVLLVPFTICTKWHKIGFFVIFMILILSILICFQGKRPSGTCCNISVCFLYFSHTFLIFCSLCFVHFVHLSVLSCFRSWEFFSTFFPIRVHGVVNSTTTRGLDWCIDHLPDARLAPRYNARRRNSIATCNV